MEINKTTPFSFPVFSLARPAGASNLPPGQAVPANLQQEAREEIIRQLPSDFINLQRINDTQNATAKVQREVDKRFQKLDDAIERMKENLGQILTQFPPFPPGSQDRVRALRTYAYFRNLIDQLTLPPPDEFQTGRRMDAGEKVVSGQPTNSNYSLGTPISS